jgi:hypothetical protein
VARWLCYTQFCSLQGLAQPIGGRACFVFFFLLDDDHFSPEADAAMSEMTGNTALLAQVCVWGEQEAGPSVVCMCRRLACVWVGGQ